MCICVCVGDKDGGGMKGKEEKYLALLSALYQVLASL